MTLLVAGHETTASQLAFAFERLVRTPDVLARLTEEVASGDGDAYVTATVQESLRRRPVLPNAAPRLVMEEIEVGGWRYPAGVCLVPNAYLVHHDPAIYPEPYAFRPERFLDQPPGHLHVDPVRRRAPALPRRGVRHGGDEDRAARGPRARPAAPGGRRAPRALAQAQHHAEPARGAPRSVARLGPPSAERRVDADLAPGAGREGAAAGAGVDAVAAAAPDADRLASRCRRCG